MFICAGERVSCCCASPPCVAIAIPVPTKVQSGARLRPIARSSAASLVEFFHRANNRSTTATVAPAANPVQPAMNWLRWAEKSGLEEFMVIVGSNMAIFEGWEGLQTYIRLECGRTMITNSRQKAMKKQGRRHVKLKRLDMR